ncbi:hypothetical protein [Deinococcus yunweiensis]|uniref:hypothetical protein n=1 Tax=Deinococcus yunweiensis TaxID=367282 RepID=UPI00398E4690
MTRAATPRRIIFRSKSARTSHHVCFACQTHYHRHVDMLGELSVHGTFRNRGPVIGSTKYLCPNCGQSMTPVGKNFRAPSKDDREAWEVARLLVDAGFIHDYTRGGMTYPTRVKDVPAFLEQHRQKSEGEQLLDQWGNKS